MNHKSVTSVLKRRLAAVLRTSPAVSRASLFEAEVAERAATICAQRAVTSRQCERRKLFRRAMEEANAQVGGELRKFRRRIARAKMKRAWANH